MFLFSYFIRLAKPIFNLGVKFRKVRDPKRVKMVSRREALDPPEAWIVQTAGKNDVCVERPMR